MAQGTINVILLNLVIELRILPKINVKQNIIVVKV